MTTTRKLGLQKFKEKRDAFKFEGEIKESVDSELEKFALMDSNSGEYIVTRNYLETIVNLPWGSVPQESFDLAEARAVLDGDHYGLDDVKKRIIEYLAVRKLKNDTKGSIILLVGPPCVGKTSVGRSIARAMNKPFFRFSVGGMRDEAEIKGHRRTYIGAMPGKIIQGLKIVKSKSPVFMIDEVDKMGQSYQGGPVECAPWCSIRAERRVPRSLSRPAVRSLEYSFHPDGEHAGLDSRPAHGPRRGDPAFRVHRHGEARDREKIPDTAEP
jgi:ATP-dependent Lon protease